MKSFVFIISTPRRDRHNTSANINGWLLDNYRANPIVMWSDPAPFSGNDADEVIGTSRVWIEDSKLMAEWIPDPTSEIAVKLTKKLQAGTSLGASVKFLPIGDGQYGKGDEAKGGKRETYYYSRQELLSCKIIPIPSNPECIYQKHYDIDRSRKMQLLEKVAKLYEIKES